MTREDDARNTVLAGLVQSFDHAEWQPDGTLFLVRDGAWFELKIAHLRCIALPEESRKD